MSPEPVTLDKLFAEITDLRREVMSMVDGRLNKIDKRFDSMEKDLRDYAAKHVPLEEIKRLDNAIADVNTRVWGVMVAIVIAVATAIINYII